MDKKDLAAQLLAAEIELRAAQEAVRWDEPGARERYANARQALECLTLAAEQELAFGRSGNRPRA